MSTTMGGRTDRLFDPTLVTLLIGILKSRRLIAVAAIVFAMAAAAFTFWQPRRYSASTAFVAEGPPAETINLSGLAAQLGFAVPLAGAGESPQFYAELLTTREILEPVIRKEYTVYTRNRWSNDSTLMTGDLLAFLRIPPGVAAKRLEDALEKMSQRVRAAPNPQTGVVSFSATMPSAALAKEVVDGMLEELNRFNLESRQSQAAAEREFGSTG